MAKDYYIGVLLCLAGSLLACSGMMLQKLSYLWESTRPKDRQRPGWRQPLNVIGVVVMGLESAIDWFAFAFANQSLLAPLGSITICVNTIMAPLAVKEVASKMDVIATVLSVAGCVTAIIFSSHETPSYDIVRLVDFLAAPTFIVYISVVFAAITGLFWTMLSPDLAMRLHRFALPAIGGAMGGLTVLLAKSIMELVKATRRGDPGFEHPGAWVLLLFMICSLAVQVRYLNEALRLYDALSVVPVYQVLWILSNALDGMIFFQEYSDWRLVNWFVFPVGVSLTLCGILLLGTRKGQHEHHVGGSDDIDLRKPLIHFPDERRYLQEAKTEMDMCLAH